MIEQTENNLLSVHFWGGTARQERAVKIETRCRSGFSDILWSWRDSNSRPNKQYASFLHAYFAFGFRPQAEGKHPTYGLSSVFFVPGPKIPGTYFRISYASCSNAAKPSFCETSCFLTILREKC